jgi:hypothetical protein
MRAMRSHFAIVKSISERTSRGLDGYAKERFLKVIDFSILESILVQESFSGFMEKSFVIFSYPVICMIIFCRFSNIENIGLYIRSVNPKKKNKVPSEIL